MHSRSPEGSVGAAGWEELKGIPVRLFRGFVVLAVMVGLVIKVLRSMGLMTGGECSPGCACSQGMMDCLCAHKTCLAPEFSA